MIVVRITPLTPRGQQHGNGALNTGDALKNNVFSLFILLDGPNSTEYKAHQVQTRLERVTRGRQLRLLISLSNLD